MGKSSSSADAPPLRFRGGRVIEQKLPASPQDTPSAIITKSQVEDMREKAKATVQTCAKSILFSAVVKLLLDLPELHAAETHLSRLAAVLGTFWEFGFALALYNYQKVGFVPAPEMLNDLNKAVDNVYESLAHAWRQAAWMIALEAMVDFTAVYKGRLVKRIFCGLVVIVFYALRRTNQVQVAREIHGLEISQETETKIVRLCRNMALCTGALMIRACTIPLLSLQKASLGAKLFSMTDLTNPVGTAGLLWALRTSTLNAVERAFAKTIKPDVPYRLFETQVGFYEKVGGIFRTTAIIKLVTTFVVPYVKALVQSYRGG